MSTGGGSQVRRMLVVVDNLADRSGIPFFLEIVDVLEQEIVVKRTDLRKIRTTVFIPKAFLHIGIIEECFEISGRRIFFHKLIEPFVFGSVDLCDELSVWIFCEIRLISAGRGCF